MMPTQTKTQESIQNNRAGSDAEDGSDGGAETDSNNENDDLDDDVRDDDDNDNDEDDHNGTNDEPTMTKTIMMMMGLKTTMTGTRGQQSTLNRYYGNDGCQSKTTTKMTMYTPWNNNRNAHSIELVYFIIDCYLYVQITIFMFIVVGVSRPSIGS